jgi:hypothetical protein
MVARDDVVHPTISSFPDHYRHPGVTFVPIRDMPPMNAGLIWRATGHTAAVRAFAQAAEVPLTRAALLARIGDESEPGVEAR